MGGSYFLLCQTCRKDITKPLGSSNRLLCCMYSEMENNSLGSRETQSARTRGWGTDGEFRVPSLNCTRLTQMMLLLSLLFQSIYPQIVSGMLSSARKHIKNSGWGDVSFAFLLWRSGDFKKLKEKRKIEEEARKKRDQACKWRF